MAVGIPVCSALSTAVMMAAVLGSGVTTLLPGPLALPTGRLKGSSGVSMGVVFFAAAAAAATASVAATFAAAWSTACLSGGGTAAGVAVCAAQPAAVTKTGHWVFSVASIWVVFCAAASTWLRSVVLVTGTL